ncbi:MAG: RNA polymerase sigma factor [Clostridia bacterium]|nr:RNA polymerase sigma factor [Clostridia bacterium]
MSLDKQMKQLSRGDAAAFEGVYKKTKKTVYYTALSILKDRSLAEDVMQNTYLKVIKNASSYRQGTDAVAWIKRICRNEALNLMKKRGHETYVDERANVAAFGTEQTDDYGLLIDLARKTLPQDEFEVLILVSAAGYKRKEISELMNIPLSTVTYKLNCATGKMIKALQD